MFPTGFRSSTPRRSTSAGRPRTRGSRRLLHGLETGIITRSPEGEYTEKHQPISIYEAYSLTTRDRLIPYELEPDTDDNGVRAPRRALNKARATVSRFYD